MNRKHLVSALALVFGVVTNVGATQLNQHGANFTPVRGTDAPYIVHATNGVSNTATTPKPVIASVDHNPSTTGETVFVFGSHNGVQTTTICVYSYNFNSAYLAGTCSAVGVAGTWFRTFALTAAQTPQWSFQLVVATLPANSNGRILGLSVLP